MNRTPSSAPVGYEVRLAELIASLALTTDLAIGQPLEHGLRRSLLATWLGQEMGLDKAELAAVYYVGLLGSVGCVINASAFADCVKDDIAFRGEMFTLDVASPVQMLRYLLSRAGQEEGPLSRAGKLVRLTSQSQAVCRDVAMNVGGLMGLSPAVSEALGQCDEHWDGRYTVLGLKGEQISVPARLFLIAQDVEVFYRIGGIDAATSVVKQRSGKYYDPAIAQRFQGVAPNLLSRLDSVAPWDAVLEAEPAPWRHATGPEFDDVAAKLASFVDMRSVFTLGHSHRVAGMAEACAQNLGLSQAEVWTVRQSAQLHDLGRAGIPVALWDTPKPPRQADIERMRSHASLTELVLARSQTLGPLGAIAGMHHERLNGSGYRSMQGASLPVAARILAVADAYQTWLEPRPHRAAMTPVAAATKLEQQAGRVLLDAAVVQAALGATGRAADKKPQMPAGLSERELDVLRLVIQGQSNRQMAEALFLSPKTVGHHIESIYAKLGVSTRVGATLVALKRGLLED
jgi:HD-GYP domain-containing protein (c-di-GMP phosphodiesterase class II)